MILRYFFGALTGLLLAFVSIFFAFGGVTGRKLFLRLLHRKGLWRKVWAGMILVSVAAGLYGAWLFPVPSRDFFTFSLLNCCLLSMSVTDLRGRYIPDDATVFFGLVFLLFQLSALSLPSLLNSLLGAAAGGAILGLPHLIRKDSVGLGDVKLLAVCGLMTGFPSIFYVLTRALVFMALFSIVQLLRKKLALRSQVPLVPFLFLGVLI